MSSSAFRATVTDVDKTGDKTDPIDVLALVLAWSADEPQRLGEVAFLPPFQNILLGRGDHDIEKFLQFGRQRPGELLVPSPRSGPDAELFASPAISRRQLVFRATGAAIEVENIGRCVMLVNGAQQKVATLVEGDRLMLGRQLLFLCVKRPKTIAGSSVSFAFGEPDPLGMVGESAAMWQLRALLDWSANNEEFVLIFGESGTGKEHVARGIHMGSQRAEGPFVTQDAGVFTESLVESQLYGNALNYPNPGTPARKGLFGQAAGGTLFLDEIGNCDKAVQAKLLRVLDHGEYRPLGGESVRVNVRVIGATNKDDSVFLHDFRARFKDSLGIPPLRERREDIPLLVRHWCSQLRKKRPDLMERFFQRGRTETFEPRIHGRVIDYLLSQPLPCNVRELEQVLVMCLKASAENVLRLPASLDASVMPLQAEPPISAGAEEETTARGDDKPSREKVLAYLERAEWNVSRAAKAMGIQRSKFYRLMEEYRIKKDPT